MRDDAGNDGESGTPERPTRPPPHPVARATRGTETLDGLLDRLLAITGDTDRGPVERATDLRQVETELLEALPRLAAEEKDFDGLRGHPTLADTGTWLEEMRQLGIEPSAQEEAQGLVDRLVQDEVEGWRSRAKDVAASGRAGDCFEMLGELTMLQREALSRGSEIENIDEVRAPVREALVEDVVGDPPSPRRRKWWSRELLDRADVVLTGIDDVGPARAAKHIEVIGDDLDWHLTHIEPEKGHGRRRLLSKRSRLLNEMQERELQHRLEKRFGRARVGRFERLIVFLIFFVLASLAVEWFFTLSDNVRIALAIADTIACGFFLTEFFVKLSMVRGKWRWFRRHVLIDLLPSLPFGLFALGEMAHTGTDAGRGSRALRLFRLFRIARYLRWLLPLIRLLRAFGFLARGLDRLVRRYGHLLNRNIILYPNREERAMADRAQHRIMVRARRLRAATNRQWHELLTSAPEADQATVARIRLGGLASAREAGHLKRRRETGRLTGAVKDTPAEALIIALAGMNPQELEAEMGEDFVERTARVVRMFSRWPIRWFPVIRKYVPRLVPSMTEAEVVSAGCHAAAREMRRHHDRWFWCADLYGTVTPSEFVDRVGTAMVKGATRPAYRLVMFSAFYGIVQGILSFASGSILTGLSVTLKTFIGVPIIVLGSICLVVLALGWWMRRIAGEATFFFEQTAKAQFLALTETIKGRHIGRDTALLDQRVLEPESDLRGTAHPGGAEARQHAFSETLRSWMVEARAGGLELGMTEEMERVMLLYRDNLDGALFGESDTRTTNQLLGNPAIRQLRRLSDRIDKKERKHLRSLDLDRQRSSIRGPYLWFSYISKAVAQSAARLIVEYNRYAIPIDELAFVSETERKTYEAWVDRESPLPGNIDSRELAGRDADYVTTAFTALHFLDDDPQRDREIAERFGMAVLTNMRSDRRLLFRRVFGTYPLHTRAKEQRVLNLYRVYERWFASGRAFFIPFRLVGRMFRYMGRVVRWVFQSVREIRHPKARHDVDLSAQSDFATAVRKISRMRGPVVWSCLWLRARFDAEYLGVRIPGSGPWDGEDLGVWRDLEFLGAHPALIRRVADERERAEWDTRRVAALIKDGLLDQVATRMGVARARLDAEHTRACVAVYRADYAGVRTLISCVDILRETRIQAQQEPLQPFPWLPNVRLRLRFRRWWQAHGRGDKAARVAAWRAIVHGVNRSREALTAWARYGEGPARERGLTALTDLLRHPGRVSEQLVTLRAIQTLSLVDLLNYREHVYRLGEYEQSGDTPGHWLTI